MSKDCLDEFCFNCGSRMLETKIRERGEAVNVEYWCDSCGASWASMHIITREDISNKKVVRGHRCWYCDGVTIINDISDKRVCQYCGNEEKDD